MFNTFDFTIQKYRFLCDALKESAYTCLRMSDYLRLTPQELPEFFVLLRHDVDRRPARSLRLAAVERDYGFAATYFFRTVSESFNPAIIQGVSGMGHEIGYHYETLSQTRGQLQPAVQLFREELTRLRQYAPITSACMHGSPLWPWDNRDIWKVATPHDFGLLGEVYLDLDYRKIDYFSDSGRAWNPEKANIRDHTNSRPRYFVQSTNDLIDLIKLRQIKRLCLSTHPERWTNNAFSWAVQAALDGTANILKFIIQRLYKLSKRS